jgi:hypothetical protein
MRSLPSSIHASVHSVSLSYLLSVMCRRRGRLCNRIANFQGFAPAHATRTIAHNQFHPLRFPSWGLTCRVYCDSYRKAPERFQNLWNLLCHCATTTWLQTQLQQVGRRVENPYAMANCRSAAQQHIHSQQLRTSRSRQRICSKHDCPLCKIRHKEGDSCCPSTINQRIGESVRLCTGLPQFAREPHYSGQPWNGSHGRLT